MSFKLIILVCLVVTSGICAQETPPPALAENPAESVVRGRVFYEDTGRPVRRTAVRLVSDSLGDSLYGYGSRGMTDGDGYYEIKNVRKGTYYPVVTAPGIISFLAYAKLSYSDAPDRETFNEAVAGFQAILVNGVENVQADIPVKRGGAIGGRITYADGDPAIGVKVEVFRKGKNDSFIPVLPNLSSYVSVTNGGAGIYQTDDRGYFRSAGLPAGKYIVRITQKGRHSNETEKGYNVDPAIFGNGSLLTMYYPDVFELSLAKVVEVELGQGDPEISIVIPDRELYAISGKVISAKDAKPFRNISLVLTSKNDAPSGSDDTPGVQITVFTDEKGEWSFSDLPKGTYEIDVEGTTVAFDRQFGVYGSNSGNSNGFYIKRDEVKFARKKQMVTVEDKDVSDVVIEMSRGAAIFGKVFAPGKDLPLFVDIDIVDEDDKLLASDRAWQEDQFDEPPVKPRSIDFDIDKIPAGKVFLRIRASQDGYYVKSAMLRERDLLTNPLELQAGQIVRDVRIVLGTDPGTVKGRLLSDKNEPVSQRTFLLVPVDPARRVTSGFIETVVTGNSGEFSVVTAPGEYAVIFLVGKSRKTISASIEKAVRVKIVAGRVRTQDIKTQDGK